MVSIGVLPLLKNKPYMLERLMRDAGLQPVRGKHLHLVSNTAINPRVVKQPLRAPISYRGPFNGGGNAA